MAGAPAPATRPKGDAEGILPALPVDDTVTADGRRFTGWIHINAPGRGAVPTVHSVCACGWNRFAVGRRKALALIEAHTDHRATCPDRATARSNAA